MKEGLISQCLYSVVDGAENFGYSFTTKNNVTYNLLFNPVSDYYDQFSEGYLNKVYQFIIERDTSESIQFDKKVFKTIDDLLTKFFHDSENVIMFSCSEEEDKGHKRHLLFDRWYKNSNYKEFVDKVDVGFTDELGGKQFGGVIISENHPYKDDTIGMCIDFLKALDKAVED